MRGRFYEALGTRFQVVAPSGEIAEAVHSLLAPFSCPQERRSDGRLFVIDGGEKDDRHYRLTRGSEVLAQSVGAGGVLVSLVAAINREAIEGFDGFAVHAGVVSDGDNVIAFPAASGEGKSTLVAATVIQGHGYVSDEALCVDFESLEVQPYPKPLALSSWSLEAVGLKPGNVGDTDTDEFLMPPGDLGAERTVPLMKLAHVVGLLRRAGRPSLRSVPRADAVGWLLRHSFNHYKRPEESFVAASRLAAGAAVWCLEYSEPVAAAALLSLRLARR